MSLPDHTIRTEVLYRLVDLAAADPRLGSALVLDSPTPAVPDEAICFGPLEGTDTFANQRSGRKDSDDEWTIAVLCLASMKGQDARVARARAEELWQIVRDAVAESPRLGGAVPGLLSVSLGKFDGPDAEAEGDGEGFVAWVETELVCKARIT